MKHTYPLYLLLVLISSAVFSCKKHESQSTTPAPSPNTPTGVFQYTSKMAGTRLWQGSEKSHDYHSIDTAYSVLLEKMIIVINDSTVFMHNSFYRWEMQDSAGFTIFVPKRDGCDDTLRYRSYTDSTVIFVFYMGRSGFGTSEVISDSLSYNYITNTIKQSFHDHFGDMGGSVEHTLDLHTP